MTPTRVASPEPVRQRAAGERADEAANTECHAERQAGLCRAHVMRTDQKRGGKNIEGIAGAMKLAGLGKPLALSC